MIPSHAALPVHIIHRLLSAEEDAKALRQLISDLFGAPAPAADVYIDGELGGLRFIEPLNPEILN